MARREARTMVNMEQELNIRNTNSYHGSGYTDGNGGNYAHNGFGNDPKYWASDRGIPLSKAEYEAQQGKKLPALFGVEWETVSNIPSQFALNALMSQAFKLFPDGFWKMESDCSLGGRGANTEAITSTFTKAWMRNNYRFFKAFYEYTKACGIAPDNSCGMHVNVSLVNFGKDLDTQAKNIAKIHNWIMNNWSIACKLFHRDERHTTYCSRMSNFTADDVKAGHGSHAVAMNYSHLYENKLTARRVEFRLVGPQESYPAFRNTMEVLFHLIEQSKKLSARDFEDPCKLWRGGNFHVRDRVRDVLPADVVARIEWNAEERFI